MAKNIHEIRDPIHIFIKLDSQEREVLDSNPFQRLRLIHQLGLTHFIYPGATHSRFEHSLGVMELASRIFDIVTNPENVKNEIRDILSQITVEDKRRYWRRVLRMAALCHDLGHLPFSHAAERDLLPSGWDHEKITKEIILSGEMKRIWNSMEPPLAPEHIVKVAIGPRKAPELLFSDWEAVLAEIITGDIFGADRIDYLLRDSHYTGVAYGKFDHYRLVDTLRILTPPQGSIKNTGGTIAEDQSKEPLLGIEDGGLHSAEALLLARYFMFSQVYFHPVRRIYDIHLKEFLASWLPDGKFSVDVPGHLSRTDVEIMAAMRAATSENELAKRICSRNHFKVIYQRNPEDILKNSESVECIYKATEQKYGPANVRFDVYSPQGQTFDFPVLYTRDQRVLSSLSLSQVLDKVPVAAVGYVFINPELRLDAMQWLNAGKDSIIETVKGEK